MGYQNKNAKQTEAKLVSQTRVPKLPVDHNPADKQLESKIADIKHNETILMWLIVASPDNVRGIVLPVSSGTTIGRHGDIRWHDVRMSREHAKFSLIANSDNDNQQTFCISPQKDRNGTMVNGKRITGQTPLQENDIIVMGDTEFVVKVLL
ncbi:MAG: hypothetical protein Phog2KO_18290 [Phototrophicaceae bacterium]